MSRTLCWVLDLGCQEGAGEEGEGRWSRRKEREGREGYQCAKQIGHVIGVTMLQLHLI